MSHPCIAEFESHLDKDLNFFSEVLNRTRTGRAHPSLLTHLPVECYGVKSPLEQVARVALDGNAALLVTPWDQQNLAAIESGIRNSDLGLNPARSGSGVRVPVPPLTGERRESLIKSLGAEAENCRIAIRNHRRDVLAKLKGMTKQGEISEDEEKSLDKQVQILMKAFVDRVDKALDQKTTEIARI